MKFIIVGIYDTWFGYSININGKLYNSDSKIGKEIYKKYWENDDNRITKFYNYLLEKYKDYDLIAVCEDGYTEIIKYNKGE